MRDAPIAHSRGQFMRTRRDRRPDEDSPRIGWWATYPTLPKRRNRQDAKRRPNLCIFLASFGVLAVHKTPLSAKVPHHPAPGLAHARAASLLALLLYRRSRAPATRRAARSPLPWSNGTPGNVPEIANPARSRGVRRAAPRDVDWRVHRQLDRASHGVSPHRAPLLHRC